ncbi:polyphosphate kinase 2 [Eisenibacter elegans]|jgi:polyphosphate kinase 2|uniref:polyphosphate kinase 2 n=1 Tax=Eisenibacter elegans TaxID=997 RepID=UPI000425F873|nr:polyphosphate kinase 2 [Eisenibacter elegans]
MPYKKANLSAEELRLLNSPAGLRALLRQKKINLKRILDTLAYEADLEALQVQMILLQQWVVDTGQRLAIIFEGRDAAGKGGTILRFTQHLVPRQMRIVALPKPTEEERGQWYFQRYVSQLPRPGEIVFFDRSWYNRAVVEPAMGFCSEEQYQRFMRQVPEFEHLLAEDGLLMIKFWFHLSKGEQAKRFRDRKKNPLKQWKLSPVDLEAQARWETFTHYRREMFAHTHLDFSPWIVVEADDKEQARLASMRYVLRQFDYPGKDETLLQADGTTVYQFDPKQPLDD